VRDREQREHGIGREEPAKIGERGGFAAAGDRPAPEDRGANGGDDQQDQARAEILIPLITAAVIVGRRREEQAVAGIGRIDQRVERHREGAIGAGRNRRVGEAVQQRQADSEGAHHAGQAEDAPPVGRIAGDQRAQHRARPDRPDHQQHIAVDQPGDGDHRQPRAPAARAIAIDEDPQRPQDQPVRAEIGMGVAIVQRRQQGQQRSAEPGAEEIRCPVAQQQPGEAHMQREADQQPPADELHAGRQRPGERFQHQAEQRVAVHHQQMDAVRRKHQRRRGAGPVPGA
jgi:hypothetical protein